MLPDFIVIGPAKAGSRWIYECLRDHPSICMAKNAKGSRFFERYYHRGIGWYENFFKSCDNTHIKGEVDETYISCPEAAERIYRHISDIKLITCLRNPINRTFSAYLYFYRMGIINESFETALDRYRKILISDSLYYNHLYNYLNYFSPDQILIMLFDDLEKNPEQFIEKVYRFLNIDVTFKPSVLSARINVAKEPRSRLLNKIAIKTSLMLRKWDMLGPYYKIRNSKLLQKILFSEPYAKNYPSMTGFARKRLEQEYMEQISGLSDLIKRDLSHWR
jgi:hypothetical protein